MSNLEINQRLNPERVLRLLASANNMATRTFRDIFTPRFIGPSIELFNKADIDDEVFEGYFFHQANVTHFDLGSFLEDSKDKIIDISDPDLFLMVCLFHEYGHFIIARSILKVRSEEDVCDFISGFLLGVLDRKRGGRLFTKKFGRVEEMGTEYKNMGSEHNNLNIGGSVWLADQLYKIGWFEHNIGENRRANFLKGFDMGFNNPGMKSDEFLECLRNLK